MSKNAQEVKDSLKKHANDTGSVEVQIFDLTNRISKLAQHVEANPKDFSTKLGLLKLVSKRRKFLKYIEKHNTVEAYKTFVGKIGLRK